MPITSRGRLFTSTVFPMIGCPPNAVCHNSCERIATGGSGAEDRPVGFSAGEQPSLGSLQAERVEQMLVHVRVTHLPSSAGGSQIHLARARRKRPHRGK